LDIAEGTAVTLDTYQALKSKIDALKPQWTEAFDKQLEAIEPLLMKELDSVHEDTVAAVARVVSEEVNKYNPDGSRDTPV
jgi:hypothetical protein